MEDNSNLYRICALNQDHFIGPVFEVVGFLNRVTEMYGKEGWKDFTLEKKRLEDNYWLLGRRKCQTS